MKNYYYLTYADVRFLKNLLEYDLDCALEYLDDCSTKKERIETTFRINSIINICMRLGINYVKNEKEI